MECIRHCATSSQLTMNGLSRCGSNDRPHDVLRLERAAELVEDAPRRLVAHDDVPRGRRATKAGVRLLLREDELQGAAHRFELRRASGRSP
mgnify:CR=1 FL=1